MTRNKAQDKERILQQLRKNPIVEAACKQVGLPRSTYYRWRDEDEQFAANCDEAIEQSTGRINDMAESQLIAGIKERHLPAITFWLKHRHQAYQNKVHVDGHITHQNEALTTEQEELVQKALGMAGLLVPNYTEDNDKGVNDA